MDIPQELRVALEQAIAGVKRGKMVSDAQTLSKRYRTKGGQGDRLLTLDSEAAAYAAARMPATFVAASFAFDHRECFQSILRNPANIEFRPHARQLRIQINS